MLHFHNNIRIIVITTTTHKTTLIEVIRSLDGNVNSAAV